MNLIIIVGVIAGIVLLKYAVGFLFKLFGFLLIVALVGLFCYQRGFWPFNKNLTSVSVLEERYCNGKTEDRNKCNCIVQVLKKDIHKRFSDSELKELDRDRMKSAYLVKKSLEYCEPRIKNCLETKGAESDLTEFKLEMLQMDNMGIQEAGTWFQTRKNELKKLLDDAVSDKEDVDKRYED